jgi:uncharacterized protein YjbJ (UPF0337 family)
LIEQGRRADSSTHCHDDLLRAEGSIDKLKGIIQERFGDSKEAIQRKLDRLATE